MIPNRTGLIAVRIAALATQLRSLLGDDWQGWRYRLLGAAWIIAFLLTGNVYLLATVLPAAVRDLKTTVSGLTTALIVCPLLIGILAPAGRRLVQITGLRSTLIGALIVYGLGLVLATASQSAAELTVGFGFVAGLAGAVLLAAAWQAIEDVFGAERKPFGVALLGTAPLAASAVGPFLGGFIADESSWRYSFVAELVVVLLLIGLVWRVPAMPTGQVSAAGRAGRLLRRGPFARRPFVVGIFVTLAVGTATVGITYALLLFLPAALGLDKFQAGAAVLPFGFGAISVNVALLRLKHRWSAQLAVGVGIVISCIGVALLFIGVARPAGGLSLAPGLLVLGMGNGIALAQLPRVALPNAASQDYTEAAGISASVSDVGYSMGIAILGAIFASVVAQALIGGVEQHVGRSLPASDRQQLVARLENDLRTLTPAERDAFIESQPPNIKSAIRATVSSAYQDGMDDTLVAALVFLVVGLVLVALLQFPRPASGPRSPG